MEFASEMVVKASLNDLRIEETPTTLKPDGRSRPPHLKTWRDGWRHLRFLLLHSPALAVHLSRRRPDRSLGLAGSAAAGLRRGARHAQRRARTSTPWWWPASPILIGVQLVMFGALARRYQTLEGVLPPSARFQKFLMGLSLEPILQAALVIFLAGVAGVGLGGGRLGRFRLRTDPLR